MPGDAPSTSDVDAQRLARERDLYRGLLELGSELDPEPFVRSALALIVETAGAERGYLELFDRETFAQATWFAVGFPESRIADVRALVSHGIIAEAVATERVVVTPSAALDPRFRDRASVRQSRIDAVICAPIGKDPPRGVLYLESSSVPGDTSWVERAEQVERFARHLAPLADRIILRRRDARDNAASELRQRLNATDFIGDSRALVRLFQEVAAVAHLDASVLLMGETGTGKTQLARLIHKNSRRAAGPFVELNCAALPEQLIESELFGALAGAHSTAARRVEGKVDAARGGTLLLDEIGELALPAQAKLLQLLQSKEYYPLGAARPSVADVRLIAASNVDLEAAVAERRFRQDLFYRLQVVAIRLPALAERSDDTAALARHFCERAQQTHGLSRLSLSPGALRAIENSVWPGNVRQLAHTIEAASIRAAGEGASVLEASHLFPEGSSSSEPSAQPLTFQEETRRFQAQLVRRTLDATDWNVSAAARKLDLTRAHIYNLIKSFGIRR